MKKSFTLFTLAILSFSILAQSPEKISYQFVVRDAGGKLVTNEGIGVKISILQGSETGTVVYQEIFNPNPESNANGLVSVEIGTGLVISGDFSTINWGAGPYYLKTETDPTGGTDYTVVGTSQLVSVPYSLFSKRTASIPDNIVTTAKIANGSVTTADLADASVSSVKIADATITTADLADGSVNSAKITNSSIATADLADGSVTSAKIADGAVVTADLASNSVTSAKVTDESLTSSDLQNRTRNIILPANALNYPATSTIITQTNAGLKWQSDFNSSAYFIISRPLDWVATTNVTLKLHFIDDATTGGIVTFFIRPRSFNLGDTFIDAASQGPDNTVNVMANNSRILYSQNFTIPYSNLANNIWVITIQREGTGETFTGDLILMSVELIYTAVL